jgi:hypothetical protein
MANQVLSEEIVAKYLRFAQNEARGRLPLYEELRSESPMRTRSFVFSRSFLLPSASEIFCSRRSGAWRMGIGPGSSEGPQSGTRCMAISPRLARSRTGGRTVEAGRRYWCPDPPAIIRRDLRTDLAALLPLAARDAALVIFHSAGLAYISSEKERLEFIATVGRTGSFPALAKSEWLTIRVEHNNRRGFEQRGLACSI